MEDRRGRMEDRHGRTGFTRTRTGFTRTRTGFTRTRTGFTRTRTGFTRTRTGFTRTRTGFTGTYAALPITRPYLCHLLMYDFLTTSPWPDYELIDSGNFQKLERFGPYVLARPEPQAIWDPHLPLTEWERADAAFARAPGSTEKGQWRLKPSMPEQWLIAYERPDGLKLKFRLGLSSFKHVGLFPEQDPNWQFIYNQTRKRRAKVPRVLNLFAYTGAATLAARAAGADVTHLDSVKQVNFWARDNMEASQLDGVRWLVEDAMKYVRREVKRGSKYQGLILDPPAYGRGPNGEKWQLEDELNEMLKLSQQLLDPDDHFFVVNLYSLGFSALILDNLTTAIFPGQPAVRELGEIYLHDAGQRKLPLGTFCRFAN